MFKKKAIMLATYRDVCVYIIWCFLTVFHGSSGLNATRHKVYYHDVLPNIVYCDRANFKIG